MSRRPRLARLVLVLLVAVAGALAWEGLQRVPMGPALHGRMPEPATRVATAAYAVTAAGAAVVGNDAADAAHPRVTLRAWTPAPHVAVRAAPGTDVTVIVTNVPARVALAAAADVHERVERTARAVTGPAGRAWDASFAAPAGGARFAVLGDSGESLALERALQKAGRLGLDFFVIVGDVVYKDREIAPLRLLFDRAPLPVYLVRGNHDYDTAVRRAFLGGAAPAFYAFTFGGASFVVLDSEDMRLPFLTVRSEQHRWLRRTLADGGPPAIVLLHRSPLAYTVKAPGEAQEAEPWWHRSWDPAYEPALVRLFERTGVRMVLAGHHHTHGLVVRGPVTYVTSGEGKYKESSHPVMAVVTVADGAPRAELVPIFD